MLRGWAASARGRGIVPGRSTRSLGSRRRAVPKIHTSIHLGRLKEIAANYPVAVEDIISVPSVQQWAESHGMKEENPFRTGCVVQNRQTMAYLIVLPEEITDDMQSSVCAAMELRGFANEVETLKMPEKFLQHLILHEIAHPLHPEGTEDECDAWAFRELKKYAA